MSGDAAVVELPAGREGETAEFAVRPVSPVHVLSRFRRSAAALSELFEGDEVVRARLGTSNWYFGRSPEWTRHVVGSRSLWADLDILPLGLGNHPTYYAMGGLPGAPPDVHRTTRRTVVTAGFRRGVEPAAVDAAVKAATALAFDPSTRLLDVRAFSRALFFHVTATSVAGLRVDEATTRQVLGWFDRWSALLSNPLTMLGQPRLFFTPAARLRDVLGKWYGYLVDVLTAAPPAGGAGLAAALRTEVEDGRIPLQEAAGYLATILFAGTEPPAHTLLWAHSLCVTCPTELLRQVDGERAEALAWEAFRVQPAVNVLVRRRAAGGTEYRSSSSEVYVVAPPLSHHFANTRRGLPLEFSPAQAGTKRFDSDEYPGLGTGAHYCIGARLGMDIVRDALVFLLGNATVVSPPDIRSAGTITTEPRLLPVLTL